MMSLSRCQDITGGQAPPIFSVEKLWLSEDGGRLFASPSSTTS